MTSLISAQRLFDNLSDPTYIIIDCRFDLANPDWGRTDYLEGHIPGAKYAHLDEHLSSPIIPQSGRHPLPEPEKFINFLSKIGVDQEKTVVVYDTTSGSYATRLWWLLRSYGHDKVMLLNGGYQAWVNAGFPIETGETTNVPSQFVGQFSQTFFADSNFVEDIIGKKGYLLIDARAPNRYAGIEEPIDAIAGHIPGAENIFHQLNLDSDGFFLPPDQLKQLYSKSDTVEEENIVVYCGSGVTSCVNLFALSEIEKPQARLYAGSWSEWIRESDRPKKTKDSN